jgi:polyketide synthase 7
VALRRQVDAGRLAPQLRGLATPDRRAGGAGKRRSAPTDWGALPARELRRKVLELVRGTVASVLGYPDARRVDDDRSFTALGIDSLVAVELRNRLESAVRTRLPATLAFDHPTTTALADFLRSVVAPVAAEAPRAAAVDPLDSASASVPAEAERIRSASATEMFALIDEELGSPQPFEMRNQS